VIHRQNSNQNIQHVLKNIKEKNGMQVVKKDLKVINFCALKKE